MPASATHSGTVCGNGGEKVVTGLILVGGENKRMGGQEKALLRFEGERLIDKAARTLRATCDEVIVVANHPGPYLEIGCPLIGDIFVGKGPLGGIYSGLFHASREHSLVVACDMPRLNEGFIRHLISMIDSHEIIAPTVDGKYQPLHAIYSKKCLPRIEQMLRAGNLEITSFYHGHKIKTLAESDYLQFGEAREMFANVNTPSDVLALEGKLLACTD